MAEELIRGFEYTLAYPECHPGSDHCRAVASLFGDISEALPYLNAELAGCRYYPAAKVLVWDSKEKGYAFRPHEIIVAPVDNAEARAVVATIVARINDIWSRRSVIVPDFSGVEALPNALDIYKLLPRTNCKKCGFSTCFAFALALRSDPAKAQSCPDFPKEGYARLLAVTGERSPSRS